MARTDTLGNFLTDVADAIRTKTGSQATIQASDFDTEIENIPSGGSSDVNWNNIGFNQTPKSIKCAYEYAKEIYDNWDNTITSMKTKYVNNNNLTIFPLVDTSNVTNMFETFEQCRSLLEIAPIDTSNVNDMGYMFYNSVPLKYVPILNTSKATNFGQMFTGCTNLTDEALNNILKMCINATSYTGTKKLSILGISNATLVAKIPNLSNYQDFLDAGWTIS